MQWEKVEEKGNLERAQCSRNGYGGHIRREIKKDSLARADKRAIRSSATSVDRSDTSSGIVRIEPKEEEREIRRVATQERATTAGSRDI